ncbi:MAG: YihY/virulence factor BrkB family protein [Actinomycetota bacterium]|nr:YihY/virulence factor BrkB family protein [Actinomycetota bacterium]
MALSARLDGYQRRHTWAGLPLAVLYKFVDDQGGYLAALLAYYGFLSMFPLLLVAVTLLGFVLHGDPHLQQKVLTSALSNFPLVGKQIQTDVHGYSGSLAALIIGILGGIYGGLGVAQAGQNAMNVVWGVPRNLRPNPIIARLRSLSILVLIGVGVLATTGLSALASGANSYVNSLHIGAGSRVLAILAAGALNLLLFVTAFRRLTVANVSTRDVLTGAAVAAVTWQILQAVGTYYVAHKLKGSREVYGVFALVLGLIAWIYLEAIILMFCAELNVVLHRRLWPRSLLTPFTDRVKLTAADRSAYGSYARSQRFKGFETIDVEFGEPPPPEGAEVEPTGTQPPDG